MDLLGLAEQALRKAGVPYETISGIQMNRSPLGGHCLVFLVFTGGADPAAILRVSTDPVRSATFKVAHDNLKCIRSVLPAAFVNSVPEPYLFEQRDGMALFLESAQQGTPMKMLPPDQYFRSADFQQDFRAVVDWVLAFNTSLRVDGSTIAPAQREALLERPIAAYRERFQVSQALDSLLSETEGVLQRSAVDLAPRHADFCTTNVLVDSDHTVRVIDWEQELIPMWPFSDLLHFMNSVWCVPYGRSLAEREDNYRMLFFSQTPLTPLLQQGAKRYAERWGLSAELFVPLSVMAWVHYALFKAEYVSQFAATREEQQMLMEKTHHVTLIRDGSCRNLEILAAAREHYVLDKYDRES